MGFVRRATPASPHCNRSRRRKATLLVRGAERLPDVPTPGGTPADNGGEDGGDDESDRAGPGAGAMRSRPPAAT